MPAPKISPITGAPDPATAARVPLYLDQPRARRLDEARHLAGQSRQDVARAALAAATPATLDLGAAYLAAAPRGRGWSHLARAHGGPRVRVDLRLTPPEAERLTALVDALDSDASTVLRAALDAYLR